jgi:hypothetical protein
VIEPEQATKEQIIEEESILAEIGAEIEAESQVEAAADPIEEESEPALAASPADIENHVLLLAAEPEPVAPQEPPAAPAHTIDVPVERRGDDIFLMQGDRRYRIRGLNKNMAQEVIKVNILVSGRTPRGESACRKFLERVGTDGREGIRYASGGGVQSWTFGSALGELRGTFGVHAAKIAAAFKLDVEDRLASILPANADADTDEDDRLFRKLNL